MKTLKKVKNKIKIFLKKSQNTFKVHGKPKVFCIGFNKTGTTSLEKEMKDLGYIIGNQMQATKMIDFWAMRDFSKLITYCKSAQFFQDAPFSYPYTFIPLDQAFPGSKFILTIRDNPEQWYNSIVKFHSKLWGNGILPLSSEELKMASGPWFGFRFNVQMKTMNVQENDPYNKKILIEAYNAHLKNVKEYFRHRPEDLLIINLNKKESYSSFCKFLKFKQTKENFPWENKTSSVLNK